MKWVTWMGPTPTRSQRRGLQMPLWQKIGSQIKKTETTCFDPSIVLSEQGLDCIANSTDKIEAEQHCRSCSYKIQRGAENQSRHDIHQVHPEQKKLYPSTPSSRIGHHSWQGSSKKGDGSILYSILLAAKNGRRAKQLSFNYQPRSDVVQSKLSQHATWPWDKICQKNVAKTIEA